MKAFVTGGTGFLGSHLVDLLLQQGHEVTCLVRPTSNLQWLKNKKVRLVSGDLLPDNLGLKEGLQNADWCFHIAGLISSADSGRYFQVNAGGARHCLDACLKAAPQLKRFILVSSMAAVGPSADGLLLDEKAVPHPITLYGQSKLEGEKIALSYKTKIPLTILRPPAIYGPRDVMIYPVFKMARRGVFAYPAGKPPTISMAYVEDVAGACLWAAKTEKAEGEIYFVADGDRYRWTDIADILSSILHRKIVRLPLPKTLLWPVAFLEEGRARLFHAAPRLHRGHVKQFFASWGIDIKKIKTAGFLPRFNLESGMESTVAGYRQQGWL